MRYLGDSQPSGSKPQRQHLTAKRSTTARAKPSKVIVTQTAERVINPEGATIERSTVKTSAIMVVPASTPLPRKGAKKAATHKLISELAAQGITKVSQLSTEDYDSIRNCPGVTTMYLIKF